MVDIVVSYLNGRDKKWQEDFNYWKEKEIKEGKTKETNRQAFGEERTREWDVFKYWFRGIEKNCKWINKVFLLVQNENHIPKWLNTDNPRLRIVFHDEYVPQDLLPTFNSCIIGMYVGNIKDLSENFIMSDDDFYFLNPISEDRFFKYNKPVHQNNVVKYEYFGGDLLTGTDNVFYRILNNNLKFEEKFNKKIKYGIYHLPEARKKSLEAKILKDYEKEIHEHFSISKFRNENNLSASMYSDLLRLFDKAIFDNPYKNCRYCNLDSKVDFFSYWNNDIVCFNDTERLDDYDKTKEKLIEFLEKKFPNKSSFEKE